MIDFELFPLKYIEDCHKGFNFNLFTKGIFFLVVTGGKHEFVPQNVYAEAEKFAKVSLNWISWL